MKLFDLLIERCYKRHPSVIKDKILRFLDSQYGEKNIGEIVEAISEKSSKPYAEHSGLYINLLCYEMYEAKYLSSNNPTPYAQALADNYSFQITTGGSAFITFKGGYRASLEREIMTKAWLVTKTVAAALNALTIAYLTSLSIKSSNDLEKTERTNSSLIEINERQNKTIDSLMRPKLERRK